MHVNNTQTRIQDRGEGVGSSNATLESAASDETRDVVTSCMVVTRFLRELTPAGTEATSVLRDRKFQVLIVRKAEFHVCTLTLNCISLFIYVCSPCNSSFQIVVD